MDFSGRTPSLALAATDTTTMQSPEGTAFTFALYHAEFPAAVAAILQQLPFDLHQTNSTQFNSIHILKIENKKTQLSISDSYLLSCIIQQSKSQNNRMQKTKKKTNHTIFL